MADDLPAVTTDDAARQQQQQQQQYSSISPFSLVLFSHQVAGHGLDASRTAGRLLSHRGADGDAVVLKPLSPKLMGFIEWSFYQHISASTAPAIVALRGFIPRYHGLVAVRSASRPVPHLVLSDLTSHYCRPCILDLKLGEQTHDEAASPRKRAHELSKYPHQQAVGFRIAGMKRYHADSDSYSSKDKRWGRDIAADGMQAVLQHWLPCQDSPSLPRVLASLLPPLESLLALFQQQTDFRFYASSLLLLYEGDAEQQQQRDASVHMIDFGHVFGPCRQRWMQQRRSAPDILKQHIMGWDDDCTAEAAAAAAGGGGGGEPQVGEDDTGDADRRIDAGCVKGLQTLVTLLRNLSTIH